MADFQFDRYTQVKRCADAVPLAAALEVNVLLSNNDLPSIGFVSADTELDGGENSFM